ncbi:MAG: SDR family oxidoreductase [Oceanospirillaceae bacterium]|nr:SDR family oxidoreductase [Oceanospirillaceae bacterium]
MSELAQFSDLKGTSVFITGGGSGIGASLTEGFIQQGAKVAFVQRSDATEFTQSLAEKYGTKPLFIQCDITDIEALQQAVATAAKAQGDIGILINNAANDARHSLEDFSAEQWERAMAVNLTPHFITAQAVAPMMRRLGGGSIINFSSISYMMGNAGYPAYATSKAAITGLTRSLARELGANNIRVNALMPGWVLTEKQLEMWATPEDLAKHLERQCLKEHLAPQDIVDATLFLASKASRMITSQALVVDGGVVVTG